MKRRAFIAAAGAAAAGGSVVPARAQYVPFQNQQFLPQLTIAVNVTLSGPLQKYGQEIVKGVQAAVDEQNRFNAPISHVWGSRALDDRNDPALAAANANVAASDSTCIAVVGNLTAAMTVAALSHYANMGFAVIVPTVTADVVTARGYHNVYRLPAKDSAAGRLFASAALEQKKGVPALAIAFDGDYGYDVGRGFVDQAKADHHPADLLLFPADKTDSADAARTVLDRSPGYVFLAGKTAALGPIVEALRLGGYTGDFGASDGFYNTDTIEKYAKLLDGSLVASVDAAARTYPQRHAARRRFRALRHAGYRLFGLCLRGRAADHCGLPAFECEHEIRAPHFAAGRGHLHDGRRPVRVQDQRRSAHSEHLPLHRRKRRL